MLAHNSWIHQTDTQILKLEWTSPGKHYQTKNNKQKWKINKISPMIIQGVTWYYDFIIFAGTMVIRQGEVNPIFKHSTTLSTFQTLEFPASTVGHVVRDFGKISHQNFQSETSASPFDSNHQKPGHLLSPQNPRVVGMRSCLKSNGKQHVSQGKSPRRGRVGPRGQVTALSLWKTAGGKLDLRWLVKHNFWRWAEMQTQQLMR